jgi:hypothetical protein
MVLLVYGGIGYMVRKLARTVAGIVAGGAIVAAGPGAAQAAQSPAAVVAVTCSASALTGAMNAVTSGETLSLASGCVYALANGLPVVTVDLVIDGNGATLQGISAPGTPPVLLQLNTGNVTINGLNFRDGGGGAILLNGYDFNSLTVNGGTFTDNTTGASGSGGAIDEAFSGAFLSVNGATFTGNSAGSGGAIFEFGNAEIIHSTFTGNTATQGGAVASDPVNGTSISDSVLRDNSATDGGGIYSYQYIGLSGSEILDNHALQGGGLYENYSQVGVSGTVFRGNSAQDGAGIYLIDGTSATFTDTTIAGNKASSYGGGIDDEPPYRSPPGQLSLTDDTVSGNYAGESGGGIYNDSGWITAVGTAIIGNIAAIAGGIGAPGGATTTLTTSPVRGNSPDNCEPVGSITGCTG